MRLLIVRHAIAEDRDEFARRGRPDAERPLTEQGRRRMERAALGLASIVSDVDLVASSPLVRAAQTAEVLREVYPDAEAEVANPLAPGGSRNDLIEWVRERSGEHILVVGHEPDLSCLAAWLVTGSPVPFFAFKKGGASSIAYEGVPGPGFGVLEWVLTPRILRRMGG